MDEGEWVDVGAADAMERGSVRPVRVGARRLALVCHADGTYGAIASSCNHFGGPLDEGTLDAAGYVTCPWHYWKFHGTTGLGEPGYEGDAVPAHETRIVDGRVLVRREASSRRSRLPHPPHPLARAPERAPGGVRVVGVSTTAMTKDHPRYSTSDDLLGVALDHARDALGCETRLVRLGDLSFRACEGFYSKSARACTWPCSITQMDPSDELDAVYEAFVHWADVIVVATPIRWGAPSSLYFKMVERMNCVQNQETIANVHLMKDKVAAFVITGGQDNVQGVAGQMLGFFAELGCQFPQFPYIAHSRGWSAEDMENNVRAVQQGEALREGARALVARAVDMARLMVDGRLAAPPVVRGGRKAHRERGAPDGEGDAG